MFCQVPSEAVKVREADKEKGKAKRALCAVVPVEGAGMRKPATATMLAAGVVATGPDGKTAPKVVTAERDVEVGWMTGVYGDWQAD